MNMQGHSTEKPLPKIKLTKFVTNVLVPAARDRDRLFKQSWTRWLNGRAPTLVVPPSAWTEATRRHALVGTAFDYLVGAIWAKQTLDPIVERARRACLFRSSIFIDPIFTWMEKLIAIGHVHRAKDGSLRRHRDFYRVLGLLADFDAVHRGGAPVPVWTQQQPFDRVAELRSALRVHYSVDFVNELRTLLACAQQDLPQYETVHYDPIFGGTFRDVRIGADGDLLIDDMLLELKTSKFRDPSLEAVLQLLGYAALDAMGGKDRIRRVGIYNPRWRLLWVEPIDEVARTLGWHSLHDFGTWFERMLSRLSPPTTASAPNQ